MGERSREDEEHKEEQKEVKDMGELEMEKNRPCMVKRR